MKVSLIAGVMGVATLVPHLVFAAPPTRIEFGAAQGVLDFCSKIDPNHDKSFDKQAKLLVADIPRDRIEDERQSAAYRQAYQTIGGVLKEFGAPAALQACQAIVN